MIELTSPLIFVCIIIYALSCVLCYMIYYNRYRDVYMNFTRACVCLFPVLNTLLIIYGVFMHEYDEFCYANRGNSIYHGKGFWQKRRTYVPFMKHIVKKWFSF